MKNRSIVTILVAALLAGCGGGASRAVPVITATPSSAPTSGPAKAAVAFTIHIPRKANSIRVAKKGQRPYYISPATESVTISVTPGGTTNTASCPPPASTCTVTVDAPLGNDNFTITLWDGLTGNGTLLSSGSTSYTIVEGVANSFNVTFNPVVNTLSLSLSTTNELTDTSDPAFSFTVYELDPDGYTIVGPGSFIDANGNPVTINVASSSANRFPTPLNASLPISAAAASPGATTLTAPYTADGKAGAVVFTASASGTSLVPSVTQVLTFTQVIHIQPTANITCATASDGETVCGFSAFANGSTAVAFKVPQNTLVEFVNDDSTTRNILGLGSGTVFPASITNTNNDGGQYESAIDDAFANLWATGTLNAAGQSGNTSIQFITDTQSLGPPAYQYYFGDSVYYTGPPVSGCSQTACSVGSYISVSTPAP
jgi:hypothetical protein